MEIRDDFILSLDKNKLKILNHPGFIFLFGGRSFDLENRADGSQTRKPASMRGVIFSHLETTNISQFVRMPEEFQDWLNDGIYHNLVDLETDLASLATLIVIIVESPGSIAELGIFSTNENLRDRIFVIYNEIFTQNNTFIHLGTYRFIEKCNGEDSLHSYKWPYSFNASRNEPPVMKVDSSQLQNQASLANKGIQDFYKKKKKQTEKLNPSDAGHQMLFIADIIRVFGALKKVEIKNYIDCALDIKIENKRLDQYIYILKKLELIAEKKSGGSTYYTPEFASKDFVRYDFSDKDFSFKPEDVMAECIDHYIKSDQYRYNAMVK
jgi:hypothetical protein